MALLPANKTSKLRLFSASKPNYSDYNGPANGDYVRYVEGLVAWSEQEQERQRLRALADKNQVSKAADSQWGRAPAKPVVVTSVATSTYAQPGSVDTAVDRMKRKAQAQAAKLQQQAAAARTSSAGGTTPRNAQKSQEKVAKQSSWVLFIGVLIAVSMFATSWLPVVIIAWVVWNVFRTVRAASRAGKS